jgi:glycosyltransferase involved in cell wall biosynthesis
VTRCSVLIPAFNAEAYIGKSIESVLSQTLQDIEVIVVDDGSADATIEVIRRFGDRVRLLSQENRGPAAARNAALEVSTGEFVALLDADDTWLPNRLERLVGYLDAHPETGFVTGDAYLVYEDEPSTDTYYNDLLKGYEWHDTNQAQWIVRYNYVHVMTVIRRALFDRHGRFAENLKGVEDWDLWIRFLCRGERVGLVREPLAYYRIRGGSLGGTRSYADTFEVMDRALDEIEIIGFRGFGSTFFRRGKDALAMGDLRRTRRFFHAAACDLDLAWSMRAKAEALARVPRIGAVAYRRRAANRKPRTVPTTDRVDQRLP